MPNISAETVTLYKLEQQFGLQRIEDAQFFPEWHENLPVLTQVLEAITAEQTLLRSFKNARLGGKQRTIHSFAGIKAVGRNHYSRRIQ